MAFAFAATNGVGPAIARFSIANHINGSDAWVAGLVMMALTDVLNPAGRRLPARPSASRSPGRHPGAGPGRNLCLIFRPSPPRARLCP